MDFKSSSWLSKNNKRKRPHFALVVSQNASSNTFDYHFNEESSSSTSRSDAKDEKFQLLIKLPIDWSLKNRVRFTSSTAFPFEGQFKASEDASGTTSFVRCIPSKDQIISASNLEDEKDFFSPSKKMMRTPEVKISKFAQKQDTSQLDTSHTAELRRFCFTWMYPNLPWLTLFPRIQSRSDRKLNLTTSNKSNNKQEHFFKDPKSEYAKQLRDDWYSSLKSLYHLVKARQCALFYVCANNFTILFRAAGVSGIDNIHAIITPTTSGMRTMLKEEGINFTMPMFDETKDGENVNQQLDGDELSDCTDDSGFPVDDDSQIFLESLGLSQQDFPIKTKAKPNGYDIEEKKKTLILIKGRDTSLLLTFLSNTDIIIPTTGSLTGIPPTLLSPVAFSGASLHPLKLKTSHVMHNNKLIHSLDLVGPVLPNFVYDLMKFFEVTKKSFSSLIFDCDATSAFTEFSSSKSENTANLMSLFASENLKDCGLSKDLVSNICQRKQQSKKVIKNVHYDHPTGYKIQL